ncbi:MAG: hypothetical protein IKA31_05810, partial [Clostridia bacterium]|nr:hypothetical protein [Clostridia bacterium]
EVAPENLSYELNYTQYSNENFVIELLEEEKSNYRLKVTALNYDENSANPIIVVSVTEKYGLVKNKGITLQKRLNVSISEAIKLNNIEVTNVSENGIYVDLTTSNTSMIQLLTKTYPLNALNSNLIYTFIPDIDTNSSILSVDNNGLIRLSEEKMGGSGYIKIVPEDCYTYDEDGDLVEDFRNNTPNLVKLVRVFIADGKTEKTAKRIYNLAEILNDTTLHYSLMRNVEISNDILNIEFSGGLYGNLNGNGGKVTIALKNAPLFKKLTQGAVVKNISITGTTTNDGFVASVNDGSIINVSVDADISEGTYNPSTINSLTENAGGIAGENNGIIENSTFSGSISGSSLVNAGGIAGINNGTIKNSTFYAYNYSLGFNSITATNVGLITAVNNQYAVVENCNSILYGVADDYSNVILGTEVEISEVNKQVIEPINIDFANISIQNSNNSIKEKDARAVLFYYATVGETLSTEEKNIVSSWNVIEYKDLFLNYNENMIVVANSNLVTTNANSLTING